MSVPKVPKPDQATCAYAKNKEGPKQGEHVQLFRMERDRNKGFYTEKCSLEASRKGWVSCPEGCATAVSQYCRAQRTACPANTPIFEDKIVHWTQGGGGQSMCM